MLDAPDSMAVSALASAPTSNYDCRLLMGRKTVLANSSSFPPESRVILWVGGRSRWTDGQGSYQGATDVHWRGWTSSTMELSLGRLADWWLGSRAMDPCSAMWLDSGARGAPTCIPLSKAVQRQRWRTWYERQGGRRLSGFLAWWLGSTGGFCQPQR